MTACSSPGRTGVTSGVVWSTKGFPVSNEGGIDPTQAVYKTTLENGSLFRIVRYEYGGGFPETIEPTPSTTPL